MSNDNVNGKVNGDLTSRSALLKMARRYEEYDEGGWSVTVKAVPVEAIEAAPVVDAVPVDVEEVITGSPAAMAYIQSLERHNVELMARIKLGKVSEEQLKRERDAAVSDLRDVIEVADGVNYCQYCKHNEDDGQCKHPCNPYGGESGWEWRGVPQEVEHD